MKKASRFALVVLFVCGVIATTPIAAVASFTLIQPDQTFAGKTYGEWSASWWQWAAPVPAESSPITDTTGTRCGVNQSGPVWFLAGTTGGPSVTRQCTV